MACLRPHIFATRLTAPLRTDGTYGYLPPSGSNSNCNSDHPNWQAEHLGCGWASGMLVRVKLDDFTLGGVDAVNMTATNANYRGFGTNARRAGWARKLEAPFSNPLKQATPGPGTYGEKRTSFRPRQRKKLTDEQVGFNSTHARPYQFRAQFAVATSKQGGEAMKPFNTEIGVCIEKLDARTRSTPRTAPPTSTMS